MAAPGVKQHPLGENPSDNQATHIHDIREDGTAVNLQHLKVAVQLSLGSIADEQEEAVADTVADHWVSNCYHYPGLGADSGGLHSPASTDLQVAMAENVGRSDGGTTLNQ